MTSTAATLQLIDELAEADMTAFPAKVWAVAMEAERLGTPTPIVDALKDSAAHAWKNGHIVVPAAKVAAANAAAKAAAIAAKKEAEALRKDAEAEKK